MKFHEGDRFKFTTTGTVTFTGDDDDLVMLDTGAVLDRRAIDAGVIQVEKLKRPKPEAGAVLTGREVCDVWWKRGTLIRCKEIFGFGLPQHEGALVLHGDGTWHSLDPWNADSFSFDDLNPVATFEIRYVA